MKRQTLKNGMLVLLALVLCVSSLSGCRGQEDPVPEQNETFMQLLSFESYEEITGTKLATGNMLGRMEINTDAKYITEGSGSLKLTVQGNYGEEKRLPYLKLDFLNTTAATCNFSEFKNISFDVYNATDKELHIQAGINVGKADGNYISSIKQTYTLKPQSWTTCTYDFTKMAGFAIYDFSSVRYMTIEFMEHKQTREDATNVLYIDNLVGNYFGEGEKPEPITYDFFNGLNFESSGHELMFTGQGKNNDAVISRVAYSDLGIDAPENGGEYALKLSHDSNFWPTFRINFGKELPAGTIITFDTYAWIDGESLYNKSIFEFSSGGEATPEFPCDGWTKQSFALKETGSYVDLFWNFDRAVITSDEVTGHVLIDNIVASEPIPPIEPEGNFWEGVDFEIPGNAGLFVGQKIEGDERRDATIERVAYADTDIPALENGGEYALKLSHDNNYWPTFRINFGEVLPKGTIITFDAYARITSGTSNFNQSIFEFSSGGDATDQFKCDQWIQLQMELPESAEYIDMFWNYDRAQITSASASAEVYIDNMIATPGKQPITPVGDFYEGLDFEIIGNVGYFVGQDIKDHDAEIEWVTYNGAKIPALEDGGSHLMKLSHSSFYWPCFRMNFGKELPAGTKITFMAYGTVQGETLYNQSIFEFTGGGEATKQFACGQWTELTITLSQNASYLDLFWNYDRAGVVSSASGAVYIDNMIAIEPVEPTGDFLEGIDFETPGNELLFGAVGGDNAWRDAVLEVVSFDGDNALKITCASSQWPVFRMNFGKTLKAGTVISFQAYSQDISDPEKVTVSIFESIPGESYLANTSSNGATDQYYYNSWADQTIVLTEDREYVDLVCNMDRWNEPGPANLEVYVDNFKAVEPTEPEEPEEPVGDFVEGITFEVEGNELLFGAVGGDNAWRDATLERVTYADSGITTPANGGEYALKLTCASSQWPVFRMNFGKTLKAGTVISFQAYSRDISDPERVTVSIFENLPGESYLVYTSSNGATDQYYYNNWTDLTIVLAEDREYVDLMCNMDRWSEPGPENLEVYVDNFKAVEPSQESDPGDLTEGLDFETVGDEQLFAGIGDAQAATIERVSYANANVTAPANGGEYALKVSHASNCWPNFRVNFGKTLKAGTVITFDVYGNYDYVAAAGVNKYMKLELTADSKNFAESEDPNQVVWTLVETWKTGTITLTADSDHVDFFYNVADGQHGNVSSWLLLDNVKAVEPAQESDPSDLTAGLDFETAGDEQLFAGTGAAQDATIERVSYADANVTAPANGGEYALKASHASNCWPSFQLNFGKTLKAGTTITFDVYGNYDYVAAAGAYKYVKLELTADSKNFAESEDPNQVVWTLVETWKTATITLTADSDHVDFFYNVADGQHGNVSSWLLLDNVKAVEPAQESDPSDLTAGLDFETAGDEQLFAGTGAAQDATIERVSYADANVAAPANGGEYALKVSHASNCWPSFRLNFGKTLKAGTTITFDVYGNYDYVAAAGVYKYVKLELTADSKNFAESEDPNQVVWTLVETWKTGTITLTADSDHVDFFYNVADGQHGNVPSWLLLDNFKAVDPEPVVDLLNGLDFETADQEQLITGTGAPQDATIERVSYADANVTAPANGGSYALKVSHVSHCWPSFRLNFGKTLKAGTTITFDVYGNYDYVAANGAYKYVKLELAADSKNVATSDDPNQVVWTLVETWKTGITITLTADCDHVDFFYNVADGQHGEVFSWLLLDNFKATEP